MRHGSYNRKEYDKKYAKEHPENSEHKRARNLKLRYGISVEDYDEMFKKQNGKCAICGNGFHENLYVDHDHVTGKVRGLLCRGCNFLLALVEDKDRLMAMQKYLLSSYSSNTLPS